MKPANEVLRLVALALAGAASMGPAQAATGSPPRPEGPCDIYAAAGAPCVAAHSTTRALYAAYNGPLYRVVRQSDGKSLNIGVVQPAARPVPDAGGYADAAAQDAFCAHTTCWIATLYDQSEKHNDLVQAPRGGFNGPAMGGFNNLPIADMAPITVMGHKAYGVFIAPGMGLRWNDAKGTAVDDQPEGQYWVINGHHFNSGCCFDYGNGETDSRDDGNGTMETTFYGNTPWWYHGNKPGPWIMTDQENNLVGCVNEDKSKLCATLPSITWRFVTAMAKGEPHHWTTLGGDARQGPLSVMFDGPRVDATYDPMRKQGAIVLGNGGDNSNGSQGTFYEGAMTAAGTFPSDATDQQVQANIVAAGYDIPRLTIAPSTALATPPGLQTFTPGSSQDVVVTFTNTSRAPVTAVALSVSLPKGWRAVVLGTNKTSKLIPGPVAPGDSVSAAFKVSSGDAAFNGDLVGKATWKSSGSMYSETAVEKVRNAQPVKINEFRISDGAAANATDAFIELYSVGSSEIDISNWSLTQQPLHQPVFSSTVIPAKTKLKPRGFYVLGLANSGLAVPAQAGDATIHVRSTDGMKVGDTITIGTGVEQETRKIAAIGTAAGNATPLWQPLPEGPVITIPAGSTNVPVTSSAGFAAGEKIALGYGATYPVVGRDVEKFEVATVTNVGKPGTQAYLGADALAGATNLKVTSVANISTGDTIRLDIDTVGHGIEAVTVKSVGTASKRTALSADASAGATSIRVRRMVGWPVREEIVFAVGDKITIGTPANRETRTVTATIQDGSVLNVQFAPALTRAHIIEEDVVEPGTGLDLTAPLKFNHAANMPFSVRGTGISFAPASSFAHLSNEPVVPLGTGISLDKPLAKHHAINAVVQDANVRKAGFQGKPDQRFGGPALSVSAGNMVLRNAAGLVVDTLNYGGLVAPWAGEGYQATSGFEKGGCYVLLPGSSDIWSPATPLKTNISAGRFPDGHDTDSNCTDMMAPASTTAAIGSAAGTTNIKVESVADIQVGQTVLIGTGANLETAVVAAVGTPGATRAAAAADKGATVILVEDRRGFKEGQAITIDENARAETAQATSVRQSERGVLISLAVPLQFAHAAGVPIGGTGITFTSALTKAHPAGAQIVSDAPTPGMPNKYSRPRPQM